MALKATQAFGNGRPWAGLEGAVAGWWPDVTSSNQSGVCGSLPRRLGFWSAMAVVIGAMIGSGIFRSPSAIAVWALFAAVRNALLKPAQPISKAVRTSCPASGWRKRRRTQ